jgi:hypothetical protein
MRTSLLKEHFSIASQFLQELELRSNLPNVFGFRANKCKVSAKAFEKNVYYKLKPDSLSLSTYLFSVHACAKMPPCYNSRQGKYMYMFMYMYIYMYACTHLCMCACMYNIMDMYKYMCVRMCMYMYMSLCMCM